MTNKTRKKLKVAGKVVLMFILGLSFVVTASLLSSISERKMMVSGCRDGVLEACADVGCLINLKN